MRWPQGWREVTLGQVCTLGSGDGAPQGDEWFDEDGEPFVRTSDVSANSGSVYLTDTRDRVPLATAEKLRLRRWPRGSLLFPKSGASALLNHRCLLGKDAYVVSHLAIITPGELINPEFLYWWSKAFDAARVIPDPSYPAIRLEDLARVKLPLPPLPEQQRIVEVLRESNGLTQAKQRALREFDQLIQARYRAQFGRYFSPQGLLNPARIGEHLESAQYGVSEAMGESGSHAVLRMNSLTTSGWLDLSDLKYIDLSTQDAAATELRDGDLLFNRTNSRELVGKCAIWRDTPGAYSFASYLVRLRFKATLLPEFLWATLNSPYGKYRLFNAAKQAVSMANVSPTDLARISIPLPPLEEQQAFAVFVREVEQQRQRLLASWARWQTLQPALITEALSGRLTAAWREQHAAELAQAARERDEQLGAPLPQVTVRITEHAPAERRTSPARPRRQALIDQLSSFQHAVWNTLRFEWRGAVLADDPAAFDEFCTSPQTAWRLEGFQAGREEVRRALEQLAAMGLIRKMSLPRANPNTGRTEYLTAFRPLREADDGGRAEEDTALADAERLARELDRLQAARGQ
ncbi:MAG TPA: restriction endonuclease subunit S [Rhodocyclaceae bacterium]|nr:restriction endonuclease subunit S [Rhodocyclaceae bacterium]